MTQYTPVLVEELVEGEGQLQRWTARTLANVASTAPGEVLVHLPSFDALSHQSGDPIVRFHVVEILEAVATADPDAATDAIPAIVDLLVDTPEESTHSSDEYTNDAEALSEVTDRRIVELLSQIATADRTARNHLSEEVEQLTAVLEDDTPAVVKTTILDLVVDVVREYPCAGLTLIDDLVQLLESGATDLQCRIVQLLGILAEEYPEAVSEAVAPVLPTLLDLVRSNDDKVRGTSVGLLAYVAEQQPQVVEQAEPLLLDLLSDDAPQVRIGSALTLGFGDCGRAREDLAALADDDESPEVRRAAEKSLQLLN